MKRLTEHRFFILLNENETDPTEIQQEYERFAVLLFSEYSASSDDRATFHNTLVFTYVELSCLLPDARKEVTAYLEKAIDLLDRQIDLSEQQILAEQNGIDCPLKPKFKRLKWTIKIFDYVEWVYGLNAILNQNGGKSTLKQLFSIFNPLFGITTTSFSQYFKSIKNRKKGERSEIFDLQKKLLEERMEKSDETPSRK
jgi:hypothetical protein